METAIKYKVIKTRKQYNQYTDTLEELVFTPKKNEAMQEEIELLTLLVEDYDARYTAKQKVFPVRMLVSFMKDHHLNNSQLAQILEVSKGYISDMIHEKKPISIDMAIKLGKYFKVEPTAFYDPMQELNTALRKSVK